MSEARLQRLGALIAVAALVGAFFALRIVGPAKDPWRGDLTTYYYPLYEAVYGRLAQGTLPLWDPFELCGVPLFATLQGGFLYPLHALYLVLPTHAALGTSAVLHLLVVGVATAALGRRLGVGTAAAVLAGVLFAMRGAVPGHLYHPNLMEAAAWLAPGTLAVVGLARGGGTRCTVGLAIALGLSWLAGYPQATVYCLYAWGALLIVLLLAEGAPPARWGTAFAGLLAAAVLGTLLAGIQLAPALELVAEGTRDFTAPLLSGVPPPPPLAALDSLLEGRRANLHLAYSFGIVGLALLPFAVIARRHRTLALGVLVLGLGTLGFALGRSLPVYELAKTLPFVGSFRLPDRVMFVTDLCFALMAALGLDTLARFRGRSGGPLPPWTGLAATGVVLLLAVVEIFAVAPRSTWLPYTSLRRLAYFQKDVPIFDFLASRPERSWHRTGLEVPQKAPLVFGVRSVTGFEPLNLRRQAEYFSYINFGHLPDAYWQPFTGRLESFGRLSEDALTRTRLLDLAAARWVVDSRAKAQLPREAGLGLVLRRAEGGLVLLENPRAIPRAFVTHRAREAPPAEQLLAQLAAPGFDPRVESFVEGVPGFAAEPGAPAGGSPAEIVVDDAHVVEVAVDTPAAGLLVLADTYYRGWRATIDGRPAPIVPTNHLFRGVRLEAGAHRVRFEFRPRSVMVGAAATGLTSALLGAAWLRTSRPRRSPGRLT